MPTVHKSVLVPYSAQQIFDLVQDVESYPHFLPWCGASEINARDPRGMTATVVIDFRGIKQSFTTYNEHHPPHRIDMKLRDGPFSKLHGCWRFQTLRANACKTEFLLDYAFKSGMLGTVLAPVFDQIARSFVDAFVRRAEQVYR